MRGLALSLLLLAIPALPDQAAVSVATGPASEPDAVAELHRALVGAWVGTLEYRDYSEPAASTKRVKLPTWLGIETVGGDLRFHYLYDDGPAKTVAETSVIRIDPVGSRYTAIDATGKLDESYAIAGLAQLREGRGSLTMTGKGTENRASVDVRVTFRIGRNILEITRETAAAGQPFSFRHNYTFVRTNPPAKPPGS